MEKWSKPSTLWAWTEGWGHGETTVSARGSRQPAEWNVFWIAAVVWRILFEGSLGYLICPCVNTCVTMKVCMWHVDMIYVYMWIQVRVLHVNVCVYIYLVYWCWACIYGDIHVWASACVYAQRHSYVFLYWTRKSPIYVGICIKARGCDHAQLHVWVRVLLCLYSCT